MIIDTVDFNREGIGSLQNRNKGTNWPVVYMIHNNDTAYIGETCNVMNRLSEHYQKDYRRILEKAEIIMDDEFNKSAALDIEQELIKRCRADGRFTVQNISPGQSASHDYYNRTYYRSKISEIWEEMLKRDLAITPYGVLVNKAIYKYSPYTALTIEQMNVYSDILRDITDCYKNNCEGTFVVHGGAGTGKTILAMVLLRTLVNSVKEETNELIIDPDEDMFALNSFVRNMRETFKSESPRVVFCTPMSGMRSVLKDVVRECGMDENLVMSPYEVAMSEGDFDIILADESHRLKIKKNIMENGSFNDSSAAMGLEPDKYGQLDWIMRKSRYRILFYDEDQSVKGSDLGHERFIATIGDCKNATLSTQMRCLGGKTFIDCINDILYCRKPRDYQFANGFEFRLFDDIDEMVSLIREKENICGLCRTVAGYSWKWKDRNKSYRYKKEHDIYDIEIEGHRYIWNTKYDGWIISKHAIDEVGCVHSTQGFDLNYVGVIFGNEINYNAVTKSIEIDSDEFYDTYVKRGADSETLKRYILNTYRVLLTRGINGCYVYACNPEMRDYLHRYIR